MRFLIKVEELWNQLGKIKDKTIDPRNPINSKLELVFLNASVKRGSKTGKKSPHSFIFKFYLGIVIYSILKIIVFTLLTSTAPGLSIIA